MLIATWNINSLRVRMQRVLTWLDSKQPDVLCLQETKTEDKLFPYPEFKANGYHAVHRGQKTYNGVAILSRQPIEDVHFGMDAEDADTQARLVSASIGGVRVISAYVPNGQVVGSEKFAYKLAWLKRLRAYLDRHFSPARPLALCGDFNVAPEPIDVHDPELWKNSVLFCDEARMALAEVLAFGLIDAYRLHHPEPGRYTWWDYRMLAFPKNLGLRIDHIFVTPPLARRCKSAEIDREARKGTQPSDHAPVWAVFE